MTNKKLTQTVLTNKQKIDELIKCNEDPAYFIRNYCYIQHPERGRIPFKLFDYQEDCIADFLKYKQNIILKSRQLGLSTVTAAYCLWLAIFQQDANILIMATKLEVGKNMVQKIRVYFQMLPAWMLQAMELEEPEADSTKYLKLSNGSKIQAIPTSVDAGRSEAVTLLVLDECAHIHDLEELWLGLKPTVTVGGRVIMFSSPNGKGNFFYNLWSDAEVKEYEQGKTGLHSVRVGKNGFHAIKLPWTVHPERNEEWFLNETNGLSERGIAQEYLCSFESSGATYFNMQTIEWLNQISLRPILEKGPEASQKEFWIWKEPQPGVEYLLCADVSRGDGEDFSAFHIINKTTSEVDAEFKGKILTDEYGFYWVEVAKLYNNAKIINEKNTFGVAATNAAKLLGYTNFWYEPEIEKLMETMSPEDRKKQIPGYTVTPKNREMILANLETNLRTHKIVTRSPRFAKELETFIWNGKKATAAKGKHDDLIMALAIGLVCFNPSAQETQSAQTMTWEQAFLEGLKHSKTSMKKQNVSVYEDYFSWVLK